MIWFFSIIEIVYILRKMLCLDGKKVMEEMVTKKISHRKLYFNTYTAFLVPPDFLTRPF